MSNHKSYDLNENIVIRACAGAGKTYTLSWRFMAILDSFARKSQNMSIQNWLGPANILVITFTKKATAELKSRILDILNSILTNENIDSPISINNLKGANNDYIKWLKRQLLVPNILTIDSFCMSILKEYPLKSGIDSSIKMMDDYESKIFYNTSFQTFLSSLSYENKKKLAKNFGAENLKTLFQGVIENQIHIEKKDIEFSSKNEVEILNNWINKYQKTINYNGLIENLYKCSKIIIESKLTVEIINIWIPFYEITSKIKDSNQSEKNNIIRNELLKLLIGTNGKFKKRLGKSGSDAQWKKAGCNKSEFNELLKKINLNLEKINPKDFYSLITEFEIEHIKLIKFTLPIFKDWINFVNEKKKVQRVLTFKDLLYKCNQFLLENEKIKQKLSQKLHHIMVDEFQDTTHYHWQIIKSVFQDNGRLKSKGLFIVGDEKQSIYRFNQADVTTFNKAIADLKKVNSKFQTIDLNWNFRSTKKLIDQCINPIFKNIFSEFKNKRESYKAIYQKTISPSKSENHNLPSTYTTFPSPVSLELFYVSNESKKHESDLSYPLYVAKLVQSLLGKVKSPSNNCIGILMRAVKPSIGDYTAAFSQLGIKVEIATSSSFFQSQEIMDIEMLISVILNPKDDIAFCGLLKSPFFSFTDSEIHSMISNREELSIYEKLSISNSPIINEVNDWIENSKSNPIDRLIELLINSKFRELAFLSEPNGEQVWGNLRKIISIIHNWSLAGDSLEKIRATLRENIKANNSENNYKISSNTKVVLMSIHKAKGLAFPYVVIPELQKKFFDKTNSKMDIDFVIDNNGNRNVEMAFSPRDNQWNMVRYGLSQKLKNQREIELFEEYKRLLYVAITRAKFGVILSGKIYENDLKRNSGLDFHNSKSYIDWFRNIYSLDDLLINKKDNIVCKNGPQVNIQYFSNRITLQKRVKNEIIEYNPRKKNISNKSYYYFSITNLFKSNNDKNITETVSSAERGTLIHKILEKNWLQYPLSKDKINNWIKNQSIDFQSRIKYISIEKEVEKLTELKFIKEILILDQNNKFNEIEVSGTIISNSNTHIIQLVGIIDVLYNNNGRWYILDYKTGLKADGSDYHKNQIQAYLHLIYNCFNIKAKGQIYYIDEDYLDEIDFNPSFFINFTFNGGANFNFIKTFRSELKFEIPKYKSSIKIIVQSKKRKLDLWNSLIFQKKLKPNIEITTFSDFKSELSTNLNLKASNFIKRYLVQKIFKNKNKKIKLNLLPGLIDQIWIAFDSHIETNENISSEIYSEFIEYQNNMDSLGFKSSKEIYDFKNLNQFEYIIIEDPALVKKSDLDFFNKFRNCQRVNLINKYIEVDSAVLNEKLINNNLFWYSFHTIEDEINFVLNSIKEKLNNKNSLFKFSIILPSMENYLPLITGLFRREGISLSIRKSEPISENTYVKAIIALLNIFENDKVNWLNLKVWLDSSLNNLTNLFMNYENNEILKLDLILRKNRFRHFTIADLDFLTEKFKHKTICQTLIKLKNELISFKTYTLNRIAKVLNNTHWEILENENNLAIKKILRLIFEVVTTNKNFKFKIPDRKLIQEILYLHTRIEYTSARSDWGVEVVSIMDSLNLKNDYVYALGLNRNVFPIQTKPNPFIITNDNYHEDANKQIFNSWILNNENLFLSYPRHNEIQEELEPTIFLDEFKSELIVDNRINSLLINEKSTINKIIINESDNEYLNRVINRHNAFINEDIPRKYFGELYNSKVIEKELNFSATSLDELFLKPYFYLLKRIWNINEIDSDFSVSLDKGDFIHKLLEDFGNKNGWNINRENHQLGKQLLNDISNNFISNLHSYNKLNIEELFWSVPTIFLNVLEEELEKIPNLIHEFSEVKFGENGVFKNFKLIHPILGNINFNGKIDRIDISQDKSTILIQDFKTGKVKWNNLDGDMSRQLFIYYLVLKNEYPTSNICISYRQLKNIKNSGFKNYFIFEDLDIDKNKIFINKNNRHILLKNKTDVEQKILECFNPLTQKSFPIFSNKISKFDLDSYYYLNAISRLESIKYFIGNKKFISNKE